MTIARLPHAGCFYEESGPTIHAHWNLLHDPHHTPAKQAGESSERTVHGARVALPEQAD